MSTMTEVLPLVHETEVTAKAQRRRFITAEKLGVLREADRCTKPDVRSPLDGLRDDALLAHALHCRRLAAYLLIARMRCAQNVRAKAQNCEDRVERRSWLDRDLLHIRLH